MKQYIGKHIKILLNRNDNELFFTAFVTNVTDTHISFIDKFKKEYSFRIEDINEIKVI